MAIKEKITDAELALVEVLEDPIFFSEFMRSTRDASPIKSLWPRDEFKYRWYQRDLITDKSEYIALTGGRAVGKCQPASAKVYTTKGYLSINKILKAGGVCELWAQDTHGNFSPRRAVVVKDKHTGVYEVTTKSGHKIRGTGNHPILTDRGYVNIEDLKENDQAIVVTKLPWNSQQNLWRSAELRYLGYRYFDDRWFVEIPFKARFKAIEQDYKRVAEELEAVWAYQDGGVVILRPARHIGKNPIMYAAIQLGWIRLYEVSNMHSYPRLIPATLMQERIENIKIFLEALMSQWGEFPSTREVRLNCKYEKTAAAFQELFLRCGVEMRIDGTELVSVNELAAQYFYATFELEGVSAKIDPPSIPQYRGDFIQSIEKVTEGTPTYAIYVYDDHNYISGNICCHNSLVLEDKQLYDMMNQDLQLPDTKELLLTTPNQAQLEPIYGRLITRITTSPIMKDFLQNRINRSLGTMDFRFSGVQVLHRARIAGTKESNLVGLHLPRMIIDEGQLYHISAYTQLTPALNTWERNVQIFAAGVPNGLRNTALYVTSVKTPRFKWYRVPSMNNPFFTKEDYLDALRKYGGEDSDEFQQLILGKHGTAALSVISRDQIPQKSYEFYNYRFSNAEINRGADFKEVLERPDVGNCQLLIAGIDTGFSDPTIIQIIGQTDKGIWRTLVRYKLQRVPFPMQESILDWLDDVYKFDRIAIDVGAGGGGTQIMQSLLQRDEYKSKGYDKRVMPIQFGEKLTIGFTTEGSELTNNTKSLGAQHLIMLLTEGMLELSEVDNEAISEIERITRQRLTSGADQYYIMNERGSGKAADDHIFASFICFAVAVREPPTPLKNRKKLGRTRGKVL